MKAMIDIDEDVFARLQGTEDPEVTADDLCKIIRSVCNGKLIPKGHGRLIILSEDAVKRERVPVDCSCQLWISDIGLSNATVAVIEADKDKAEGSEKK